MRLRRFISAKLHRKLFVWLGFTILATVCSAALVFHLIRPEGGSRWDHERMESVGAGLFARVWHDSAARRGLAHDLSQAFEVDVSLQDAEHRPLETIGARCVRPHVSLEVDRDGRRVGYVNACWRRRFQPWVPLAVLFAAGSTLWLAAGLFARRLVRPLEDLVRVTQQIGAGNLKSRIRLRRHHPGEVGVLAESVNDMAARIERQIEQQRQLLAVVSHEIRSPLARMRVLLELLRGTTTEERRIDELERELAEIDDLVGRLLASSRLEFDALERRKQPANSLAARALERASLPGSLLVDESGGAECSADATLVERALANLLDNARRHGGGALELKVRADAQSIHFEVSDRGPGLSEDIEPRAFEPFVRGKNAPEGPSLGLGLALVDRIARAHGGNAWAENRSDGGAKVGFRIPRT
jgi:signal transduction histidine kinase